MEDNEKVCLVETLGSWGEGSGEKLEDVGLSQKMDKGPIKSLDFIFSLLSSFRGSKERIKQG